MPQVRTGARGLAGDRGPEGVLWRARRHAVAIGALEDRDVIARRMAEAAIDVAGRGPRGGVAARGDRPLYAVKARGRDGVAVAPQAR